MVIIKSDIKFYLFIFNFVVLFEWWPYTKTNLTMFWLYTTYEGIKLLKSLYILHASPITYCRTFFLKQKLKIKK